MDKLLSELQTIRFDRFKEFYANKLKGSNNSQTLKEVGLKPSRFQWIVNQDKELKNHIDFRNHKVFKPHYVNKNGQIFTDNPNGDRIKLRFKLPENPKSDIVVDQKGFRNKDGKITLNFSKQIRGGSGHEEDIVNYAINRLTN